MDTMSTPRAVAMAFLREALAGGPRPTKEVEGEARKVHVMRRTLERARADIGVSAHLEYVGKDRRWMLALADKTANAGDLAALSEPETEDVKAAPPQPPLGILATYFGEWARRYGHEPYVLTEDLRTVAKALKEFTPAGRAEIVREYVRSNRADLVEAKHPLLGILDFIEEKRP
jgi:hypothetical protein